MQPKEYGFNDRLEMSVGVSASRDIEKILFEVIPGSTKVFPASNANDRSGTDWWVEHDSGRFLSVDCKVREKDYAAQPVKADDLALETLSVVEKGIPGWTRSEKKRSDFILWFWLDTGRWCLVPFPMLCKVFQLKWRDWAAKYRVATQFTPESGGYHSKCVFVPRKEVWAEIYKLYGGNPTT